MRKDQTYIQQILKHRKRRNPIRIMRNRRRRIPRHQYSIQLILHHQLMIRMHNLHLLQIHIPQPIQARLKRQQLLLHRRLQARHQRLTRIRQVPHRRLLRIQQEELPSQDVRLPEVRNLVIQQHNLVPQRLQLSRTRMQ